MTNTQTIQKAIARNISIESAQRGEFAVIDDSVNRKVAHVSIIRGFLFFSGNRRTAFEGLEAVVAPRMEEGPNHPDTIRRVLDEGLLFGRDDQR